MLKLSTKTVSWVNYQKGEKTPCNWSHFFFMRLHFAGAASRLCCRRWSVLLSKVVMTKEKHRVTVSLWVANIYTNIHVYAHTSSTHSETKSITMVYSTVFSRKYRICITNQWLKKFLYLDACQDTHWSQSFFFSLDAHVLNAICWAAEWKPVFTHSLSCDLWSVWTAWPTEELQHNYLSHSREKLAHFVCKSLKSD